MSHSNTQSDLDTKQILQSVLHAIAQNPMAQSTLIFILEKLLLVTRANAGCFVVFDEVEIFVAQNLNLDDATTADVVSAVSDFVDDLHIGTNVPELFGEEFAGWMVAPISQQNKVVAVLIGLYEKSIDFNDDMSDDLDSMLDAFSVVTFVARQQARHARYNRNQQEFIRIVTHDMRSPLTSMGGFGSMLESQMVGDLNEKQAYYVDKILSGIDQLSMQIDNMQDAGRYDPESGFYEMERTPTDLIEVIDHIVSGYILPAEKQELQLRSTSEETLPIVNVDQTMIERSIINLVDNAIKYTPNGGEIEVSARQAGDDVIISVRDNGLGISAENIGKLFNRHFRIHRREHKRVKGSGLGLFIVRSVALKHGGDAWVESEEGKGSTFFIKIPLLAQSAIGAGAE